jgi:hypothetical protein
MRTNKKQKKKKIVYVIIGKFGSQLSHYFPIQHHWNLVWHNQLRERMNQGKYVLQYRIKPHIIYDLGITMRY